MTLVFDKETILSRKQDGQNVISLDESGESKITLNVLPESLLQQMLSSYDKMFSLHPSHKDKVIHVDGEGTISRYYKSYGNTPKYNKNLHTSYMFGDMKDKEMKESIPSEFVPLHQYFSPNNEYNQFVINWYENGNDYIAYHSDYDIGRTPDSDIVVVNINGEGDSVESDDRVESEDSTLSSSPRFFILKAKNDTSLQLSNVKNDIAFQRLEIELIQGLIITMSGLTQKKFRHGVPANHKVKTSRISFTLRNYIVET